MYMMVMSIHHDIWIQFKNDRLYEKWKNIVFLYKKFFTIDWLRLNVKPFLNKITKTLVDLCVLIDSVGWIVHTGQTNITYYEIKEKNKSHETNFNKNKFSIKLI